MPERMTFMLYGEGTHSLELEGTQEVRSGMEGNPYGEPGTYGAC